MEFPKTMKEFIDNYSFKDSDEVYTNGSMLIQAYRVEQAIEHYEKEIRNKAIDEFAEALKEKAVKMFGQKYVDIRDIDEIAEQMKKS